jgi:hypothetical protein
MEMYVMEMCVMEMYVEINLIMKDIVIWFRNLNIRKVARDQIDDDLIISQVYSRI